LEIDVEVPGKFADKEKVMRVPHTDEVKPCDVCNATGDVTCGLCKGGGTR
jgi:hypothetical protein